MPGGFGDKVGSAERTLFGFYWGTVVARNDPLKLGRVRIHIDELTRGATGWAVPVGMPGSGYPTMGAYVVPVCGSTVIVGFVQGDFEEPFYLPGPHRKSDAGIPAPPTKASEADADDAPQVRVLAQTENFQVYIEDISDSGTQRLVASSLDNETAVFSMNLQDGSIRLNAVNDIVIEAGRISINALKLQLNDRPVSLLGDVI